MKYKTSIKTWGILVIVAVLSTGCSYNIPKYGVSVDNVNNLKSIKTKINVGEFTAKEAGKNSITCRGAGGVGTPDKTPFDQYIKNALISELKLAGKFNENSKITISGHLDEVDFNSNIGTANWIFKLNATSSNSKSIVVNTIYEYEGSFVADKACSEVAQAFIPAVQKLINDLVSHRDFNSFISSN